MSLRWATGSPSRLRRARRLDAPRHAGGEPAIGWFVPVFVATTLLTISAGPLQAWAAWRNADRSLRGCGRWFWLHLVLASLGYTELKNVIARTAYIKEAMRERPGRSRRGRLRRPPPSARLGAKPDALVCGATSRR